jgi:hypothetical protein
MIRVNFFGKARYCLLVIGLLLSTPAITNNAAATVPTIAATQSPPYTAHDNARRAQVLTNFHTADVDKNEQLNQAEFKTFINLNADHNLGQTSIVRRLGMYAKAFKKADANGDGVVTKEEIAAQAHQ